jgi:hypothetical protein
MCTASFILCGTMDVTVHNQYTSIKLVSPVYFCNHEIYNEYLVERTDASAMMKISLNFDLKKLSNGILMYELQRKEDVESDCQSITNNTFIESIGNTPKIMRLLVAWEIKSSRGLSVHIMLVEHDRELALNEDRLRQLYQKYWHPLNAWFNSIGNKWLLDDTTVLTTIIKVKSGSYGWDVFISEERIDDYVMKPLWIDAKR